VLRARLATAAVAIPLLLFLIFWAPPWALASLVGVLAFLALVEYAQLAFPAQPRERAAVVLLGTLVLFAALAGPGQLLVASLVTLLVVGLVRIVLERRDYDRGLSDLGVLLVGVLYVGLLMPHFVWLRRTPDGSIWVTFVIAVGMGGDTAGYFVGRFLGRHPLIPHISPGKTVEGALGVVVGGIVAGAAVKGLLMPLHGWAPILMLSALMGVLGQLGDLGESVMKRTFGAKESGWIFPGHGGVLDRVDSLLFPVSLVYYSHRIVS
jgi:phosphatidate cytidylyltransferase